MVTTLLIWVFAFANAKSRFSHDVALMDSGNSSSVHQRCKATFTVVGHEKKIDAKDQCSFSHISSLPFLCADYHRWFTLKLFKASPISGSHLLQGFDFFDAKDQCTSSHISSLPFMCADYHRWFTLKLCKASPISGSHLLQGV